ncbi:MAG: hypothetical protein LBN40_03845 [Oscillospiraceae bacterium]|nr:hypothetical protein [Oscillospiraceae bacterium]
MMKNNNKIGGSHRFSLKKVDSISRYTIIAFLPAVALFLCVARLMSIQVVNALTYAETADKTYTAEQTTAAARGQIFDSEGRVLNTNRIVYTIIVQRAFLPDGKENEVLAAALPVLKASGITRAVSAPITMTKPYKFTTESDERLSAFRQRLQLNADATVDNCVSQMRRLYGISDAYDDDTARAIADIRYEMELKDFSFKTPFIVAKDVSFTAVMSVKERGLELPGFDIIEEPVRVYEDGATAPHIRGTIGAIDEDEYAKLKDSGYFYNDTLGKSGVESAMEGILRGTNGTRQIIKNKSGSVISDEMTTEVKPGNSVRLTIDSEFQDRLQQILADEIHFLHNSDKVMPVKNYQRGLNTEGGAVVVLEVKTGKVLGMASYPSYDINDMMTDYSAVLNEPLNPLYNRAIYGLYRPGSTFKTITGTAALAASVMTPATRFTCTGVYQAFTDFKPRCTGTHGSIDLRYALQVSCNIFFYEAGRKTGIDSLADTASHFGFGQDLGLEIGGNVSRMTTPAEYLEQTGNEFTEGDIVQAAIGQSETYITPMNLAVQAMMLANNGVRYKPYIVDSVWNYSGDKLIYETQPIIADEFLLGQPDIWSAIREGMISVTDNWAWPPYDLSKHQLKYLPDRAACKTGTPEAGGGLYNSTITGYYPAHDPVIAFGVVLENSDFSRYMIRNIIDAYFYDRYEIDVDEDGIIHEPWKEWSAEEQAYFATHNRNYN